MIQRVICALITGLLLSSYAVHAQYMTREETNEYLQETPLFSMYKDNYFITGGPLNSAINKNTADVKYQVSVRQRVSAKPLFWDTHLVLSYTQKAFWNIWAKSSPFRDLNFNPAAGLYKSIYTKDNELSGIGILSFEHESNGRDSIQSRSWNKVSLAYVTRVGNRSMIKAEVWAPIGYKDDNRELLDYVGLFKLKYFYDFIPDKLSAEVKLQKGLKWNGNGVLRTRIYYNPFQKSNQYFMLEWYMGHAESLLDYQEFRNRIRVGYVIKTNELDFLKKKSKPALERVKQ